MFAQKELSPTLPQLTQAQAYKFRLAALRAWLAAASFACRLVAICNKPIGTRGSKLRLRSSGKARVPVCSRAVQEVFSPLGNIVVKSRLTRWLLRPSKGSFLKYGCSNQPLIY